MAVRVTRISHAKQILGRIFPTATAASGVPRGHIPVYVGETKKRFVIPLQYLKCAAFQDLLRKAEEEFGFDHPMGGITIPCNEEIFLNLTSHLHYSTIKAHEIRPVLKGLKVEFKALSRTHDTPDISNLQKKCADLVHASFLAGV